MNQETENETLETLKAIQQGQQEIIEQLKAQRELAEQRLRLSQLQIEESIGLQKEAMGRQRTVTLIAVPGIVACIAAIAFLVIRYF